MSMEIGYLHDMQSRHIERQDKKIKGLEKQLSSALKQRDEVIELVKITANQLEGVSAAFQVHGLNLNPQFFIYNCLKNANDAREFLAAINKEGEE